MRDGTIHATIEDMRHITFVLLSLALVSCGGSSGRLPPVTAPGPTAGTQSDPAVQRQLQGTWELVGFEMSAEPGQSTPRAAEGQLTYDQFANLAVHAELAPGQPGVDPSRPVFLDFVAKASPDPSRGELAYVGLTPRASPDRMVPNATDPGAWRHFELNGDTLRLSVEDSSGRRVGTLTFRRVG